MLTRLQRSRQPGRGASPRFSATVRATCGANGGGSVVGGARTAPITRDLGPSGPALDLPPSFADRSPPEPVAAPAAAGTPASVAAPSSNQLSLEGPAGTFALTPGEHVVGRQPDVSIYVQDRQVSRAHAVITVSAGAVTIEDKASANGTFVNNERLSAARTLKAGDEVRFGDVRFTVVARP